MTVRPGYTAPVVAVRRTDRSGPGTPPAAGRGTRREGGRPEGWRGWDEYAPFYDWENAQTLGRRDVPFWRGLAARTGGATLELGCGTGRILVPLARAGIDITGIDRSAEMLARARRRLRRARLESPARLTRGDVRALPFADGRFALVIAPYGLLQSLLSDRDLTATLASVHRVLAPGGTFALDLVPDVPHWREYRRRVTLAGRRTPSGPPLTLVESVRQDRRRRLTIFEHEYVEGWGRQRTVHRFTVTFRTLPVPVMLGRLERAGFGIRAVLGGYDGGPWDERAEAWIVLAEKR
jgi:SAM-dependent methyltransferase